MMGHELGRPFLCQSIAIWKDYPMTQQSSISIPPVSSDLEKEHAAMLKEALARPGVREVMEVYGAWLEKDQHLDTYRSATTDTRTTVTSTSSHA